MRTGASAHLGQRRRIRTLLVGKGMRTGASAHLGQRRQATEQGPSARQALRQAFATPLLVRVDPRQLGRAALRFHADHGARPQLPMIVLDTLEKQLIRMELVQRRGEGCDVSDLELRIQAALADESTAGTVFEGLYNELDAMQPAASFPFQEPSAMPASRT